MKKFLIVAVIIIALGAGAYFAFFYEKDDGKEPEVILYNIPIEDSFITNVKGSEKLFKSTIVLVVNKKDMDEFFEENIFTTRDTILFILRELSEDDITSTDIQDYLRVEIAQALNKSLGIDNIVSVYFNDFVMQ